MTATLDATIPCKGGDEWHSDDTRLQRRAADLCRACSLLDACARYAIASNEPTGVWGGLTPRDRAKLRRKSAA
jgi:WhiB family redox-sensing transcriptional regulator